MLLISLLLKIFLVLFWTVCYAIGGQGHKWVRRFLGAGVFGGGVILLSVFKYPVGISWIFFCAAGGWYIPSLLIFKYGVNEGSPSQQAFKKVLLRGIYGLSLGISGLLVGFGSNLVGVGLIQLFTAMAGSILFGVFNPFSKLGNAGVFLEDLCIAFLAVFLTAFMI